MNSIHREAVYIANGDYQELMLTGPIISAAADRNGSADVFDIWYEHYADREPWRRSVWIFGTGHPVPWTVYTSHAYKFVGTVVTKPGLVWHIYTGHLKGQAIGV